MNNGLWDSLKTGWGLNSHSDYNPQTRCVRKARYSATLDQSRFWKRGRHERIKGATHVVPNVFSQQLVRDNLSMSVSRSPKNIMKESRAHSWRNTHQRSPLRAGSSRHNFASSVRSSLWWHADLYNSIFRNCTSLISASASLSVSLFSVPI